MTETEHRITSAHATAAGHWTWSCSCGAGGTAPDAAHSGAAAGLHLRSVDPNRRTSPRVAR